MPQIQILPEAPGFGSQLGEALGGGIGKGIQEGISTRLSSMLESKKELGNVRSSVNQLAKRYGKDAFTPEQLFDLEKNTSDFIRQNPGLSAQDASTLAFIQNQQKADQEAASSPKEMSFWEKLGGQKETFDLFKEIGSNAKSAAEKAAFPFVGHADFVQQALQEIQSQLPGVLPSAPVRQGGQPKSFQESYLEATGGVGPGETKAQRMIQGALGAFHPAGAAGTFASEAAEELGAPPVVQAAADALGFILAIKSGPKVGSAFKANQKVLSNAERIAEQTGLKAEDVIAKAQQESGADLTKAAQGDAKEINKLNGRISAQAPKVAEKVAATEKTVFNPEAAMKQREKVTAERLSKSPYTAYYEIENKKAEVESNKTPARLAKEKEITERLAPIEREKTQQLEAQRSQLKDLQRDAKNLEGSDRARVETTIAYKKKEIQKTLDELRDLRHELKHFEKRPSDAQLEVDARKSAQEFVEEARNPTEAGQKKIARQLELDKKFIERAEELLKHAEIPLEIHPDTFLRVREKYLDAYKGMAEELREVNRSLKGARDAESLKKIAENRKAIEHLEGRNKRLKADIINQKDKIKALSSVKGAKGAFYKQQLKDLRKDIEQFQKDFFKGKNAPETKAEIKTAEAGKKAINESSEAFKAGEKAGKNPTKENIKEAAEKVGENPETVQKEVDQLKEKMEANKEKIENGTATEKDVKNTENGVNRFLKTKSTLKTARNYFFGGVLKGLLEEKFDLKIPSTYSSFGLSLIGKPSRTGGRAAGLLFGNYVVKYLFNKYESNKLNKLRSNPNEYTKHVQSLKKRYAPKRVNEIIENSK